MDLTSHARRVIARTVACAAIAVPVIALTASAATSADAAPRSATAATPECRAANIEVWLGLNPDGAAAGTTFYPIEFSNVGFHTHTCWMSGNPTVTAITSSFMTLGPAAGRNGPVRRITLRPGQSAHALLGIVEDGIIAGCTNATGAGLEVTPPGEAGHQPILSFTFPACTNKVFMHVSTVQAGISIP